MRQLQAEHTCS
jgi:hypothetical protein